MRYAISFTTPAGDPLSFAAASWLGRSVYSGEAVEHPAIRGLGLHEIAFHTALPRRYGFHASLKAPFRMDPERTEASLLRDMMRFAGTLEPFDLPRLEVARLGDFFGLMPTKPCPALDYLAAAVVQEFDSYRAPLTEGELERMAPERLTAPQFANLYRWGHPYAMEEFRFHMTLTGPLGGRDVERFGTTLNDYFGPLLCERIIVNNLALFFEREPGAPFQVHSLHPMGRVSARRTA